MSPYKPTISVGERTEQPNAIRMDIRRVVDIQADVRALPFADNSIKAFELYHVLEHLLPDQALAALGEIRRVLYIHGVLWIAVPDLEECARSLLDGNINVLQNIYSPSIEAAQQHRWGYTADTLEFALQAAGFAFYRRLPSNPRDTHEIRYIANGI